MRAGAYQLKKHYLFIFIPNKQQIRFYVTFPITFIVAAELMDIVFFR